ncbi:helix-turn-helix transcriptional regulator [Leptolyngbya cf. ectocarpi LEGE 11479]|uniref:Helix-turn-helix transcriptional regulator n=1 Tax=Leptolyngbya cf. ectocarpi LEGE 11479 TaxID=1828722 RepID=A0A928WYQ9_LEPEC|nr:AraC family transcriptional regulator [Leptolyngbya ectocarpi]MBE9065859.1 helix-turn-helix transcriptional regulator [Leptolyngbya cf. ectocarpi LEGE 11479]
MDIPEASSTADVSVLSISQATRATFTDLYFQHTFLVFIQVGSKRVLCPINGELIGHTEDVMIFSPGSIITLENRPVLDNDYRATGVCFPHQMIETVFSHKNSNTEPAGIQIVPASAGQTLQILHAIQATLNDADLPEPIKQHRLLEPLIWLKYNGIHLSSHEEEKPLSKVRRLIETDLSHPWRSNEVADHFAISEATMRRWLAKSGQGFSKILQNTRLEHGLSLLQSTDMPISAIAYTCGFKTPSHFSDSFRKRFGIQPSEIRKVEV